MINHLIFDLDKTVYSGNAKICKEITKRIIDYCAGFLGVDVSLAESERNKALKNFNSTLAWLKSKGLSEQGVEEYFAAVHPKDEINDLPKDPGLRPLLESIKMPKVILTNSTREHAEYVLSHLGVRDLFMEEIIDIRRNGFKGKPDGSAYETALKIVGGTVENTLFLDDWGIYVAGYASLGGIAVQVGSSPLPDNFLSLKGKVFQIKDIYGLPSLLEKINGQKL